MILTYLCFRDGAITPAVFADWVVQRPFDFVPTTFRCKEISRKATPFRESDLVGLRRLSHVGSVALEDGESTFRFGQIAGWPSDLVVWEQATWPNEEFLEAISRMEGFCCALVGDSEDVFWQSTSELNTYEVFGRSSDGLPRGWDPNFECETIDISGNFGRSEAVGGMWVWAASKMWLGSGYFELVDRAKLLRECPGEVRERSDGVVVVDLFRLGDDLDVIRDRQKKFWMAAGYDALLDRSDEIFASMSDPSIEINEGSVTGGRQFVEWLFKGKQSVRSKADAKRIREFDENGALVSETVVEV